MIIRYRLGDEVAVGLTDGHRVFRVGDELAPLLRLRVADLRALLDEVAH